MILYSRHPRFTVALLVLIFIIVFLSANENLHDPLFGPAGFLRHDRLAESLKAEELQYQKMVKQRQDLVKKWGPTADKIDPFPSHGEHYTLWDFFLPSFKCPHRVERVGVMGDGGKWLCGLERIVPKKSCVVYSVGINGESSFEADILKAAPNCEVWGYDFSVNSFGPEIEFVSDFKRRSHFFPYALGPRDALGAADDPKMFTLRTLMERNGHNFIDVLKIDIEGDEFESLEVFIDSFHGEPLPFGQLQLELHVGNSPKQSFPDFLEWWEKIEAAGLRPFFSEPNLVYLNIVRGVRPDLIEYSFINVLGNHELVSDHPQPHRPISHLKYNSASF